MNNEMITQDGEIVHRANSFDMPSQSIAMSLARAEIDQAIATARALPRSINQAIDRIMTLATLDEESAKECVYSIPRDGKTTEGPSVRMAEIISSQWGNCRIGARVVHVDRNEKFIEAEGVFHDLETNASTTARVRRRISTKAGKVFSDDMIIVTGNAACSIAKRNAILAAVPKGVWRKGYDAVKRVIAGDIKTLAARRAGALEAFAGYGVEASRVFQSIGVNGIDDIGLHHMVTLTGMYTAIKNGEETVDTMFPREAKVAPPPPPPPSAQSISPVADIAPGPIQDVQFFDVTAKMQEWHDAIAVADKAARMEILEDQVNPARELGQISQNEYEVIVGWVES